MQVLKNEQFYVKPSKCCFGQRQLEYLGQLISGEGVKVDESQAMVEWPQPTTVRALRGFLGLIGYYQKFVHDYCSIARPLTNLLKKWGFEWNDDREGVQRAKKMKKWEASSFSQ